MNYLIIILFSFISFLSFAKTAFAVATTITELPLEITDQPFTIHASVSGASDGTNYLRIDLYKEGTSNYFGETYNGQSWIEGSSGIEYLPITIVSGEWSGVVQGRIGNPSLSEYNGPGMYKVRLRRYTSSGNYTTTEANDNQLAITIAYSLPTSPPTSTPSPVPSNTPTPTRIPTPTKTPTPSKITSSIKPSQATNSVFLASTTQSDTSESITGEIESTSLPDQYPTPILENETQKVEENVSENTVAVLGEKTKNDFVTMFPKLAIIIISLLFLSCGILLYLKQKNKVV